MTNSELNKYIASLIVAVGPGGSPSSHVWMLIDENMENLDRYNLILGSLQENGIVEVSNHFVKLTRKGLETYNRISAILQQR
jgi:predicted methyltransferase